MERKLMKGAPKKAIMDLVNKSIDESSISSEASACALMTEAVSIMLADIDRRMKAKYSAYGLITKRDGEDILTGMSRYCQLVRMCMAEYEKSLRSKFEQYTFGYGGVESLDSFSRSANDIARLVMKLCDKGKVDGVLSKIERYIDRFKEQGRFTEEDYERFVLR